MPKPSRPLTVSMMSKLSPSLRSSKTELEKHQVKLTLDDGKTKTYKVDKSAQNLDQVQPGDHLKIGCTEELLVTVNKSEKLRPQRAEV